MSGEINGKNTILASPFLCQNSPLKVVLRRTYLQYYDFHQNDTIAITITITFPCQTNTTVVAVMLTDAQCTLQSAFQITKTNTIWFYGMSLVICNLYLSYGRLIREKYST